MAATTTSAVEIAKKIGLCGTYIVASAGIIRYNKYLMHENRFPFSMALTAIHMMFSFALCSALYYVRPGFFPGMQTAAGKRLLVLKWFIPIGSAFAISLYCSNQAYLYCNVTFLQFLKEANVVITFAMSCAVGLQVINRTRLAIIVWVIVGSSLAVSGEMHFVVIGFIFQIISQFAECSRAVMGEFVLSGGGLKLDPLSYTMFIAPTCLVVLIIGNMFAWDHRIPHQFSEMWPLLIPNALLAFVLNVLVAAIIKEVSAVGFILTGVVKDIAVVLFSAMFFGERVVPIQLLGFALALTGVMFWSLAKVMPESAPVRTMEYILGARKAIDSKDDSSGSSGSTGPTRKSA